MLWDKIFSGKLWYSLLCIKFCCIRFFLNCRRVPLRNFRHCETTCFRRKIEIPWPPPPLHPWIFSLPEAFWKTEGFFYEVFRSWETKVFRQTRYTPHSNAWKLSISEFIWNTDVFIYEIYRHCEKKFKREKWYLLLMHEIFYTGKVLKYRKDPLGCLSVLWVKNVDKSLMTLPAAAILCIKIFDSWIFLNQKTAPFWFFTALWERSFLTENRVTAHLCIKIFGTPKCVIHWMSPRELFWLFWYCETKHFEKTVMTPPLCENFGCKDSFEKSNGSHTIFFSPLRQKFLTDPWCPPPLHESFWYQVRFSKHRGVRLRIFSALWNKKKSTKSWCRCFFSAIHSFISVPESFWNNEASRMKFFSAVRQNFFGKTVILPPMHQILLYQIFFEMQNGSPTSFLGVMRHKKFFDRTVMSSLPPLPPSCEWQFSTSEFFWNTDVFPCEIYR